VGDAVEIGGADQAAAHGQAPVAAPAQLERDEAVAGLDVEERDDVRAADLGQGLGLGEESSLDDPGRDPVAAGVVAEQALDRDRATDPAVVGFVDDGVAATAEGAAEFVAIEADPAGELE